MKTIIIFLLVIIVGIMGYNFYYTWQRFHPPNYQYETSATIPKDHADKDLLLNYHEAVARLDGYVITQWSTNDIDVRNPEDDDATTLAAVEEYASRLATVKFYESRLTAPPLVKVDEPKATEEDKRTRLIKKMFYTNPKDNSFKLGDKNALVYEVQRILIKKGHTIVHDGLYRLETQNALKNFEAANGLFPDGKLDAITLEALLQ